MELLSLGESLILSFLYPERFALKTDPRSKPGYQQDCLGFGKNLVPKIQSFRMQQ